MRAQDRLTPELLEAILADVRRGVPAYRAAHAHGVAKSTFYDWLRWGRAGRVPYAELVARLAPAPRASPDQPPLAAPVRSPFVGRERELAQLRAGVEAACGGRGRLFVIVGDAGIGKTRLGEEIAVHARERGMRLLIGRCYEGEGAPPFWPWVQIVRSYARERKPAALLAELGAWAPDVAQIVPEVHAQLPGLPPALALDPAHARFRFFDGMSNFLRAAAAQQPLMLVLDDLHWADRPSLLLLRFLAGTMADTHLLVAAAYRDTEVRPEHPLLPILGELAREPVCERMTLRGLAPTDVARFIELYTGRESPGALADRVHERGEGNPFFVTELVRLLADGDLATGAAGATASHLSIPRGVRAVIARRLDRLSETCNRVLTLAAAFGREFALPPLVQVSDMPAETVLDALGEAVRAGLVAPVPGTVARYSFSHALVRESLYEELGAIRRARLHRRIAEVLVDAYAGLPEPHLDELAHHFAQAAVSGEGAEAAIDYAVRAAEYALERLAYEQAAQHYELALRSLAHAAPDEHRRCRLLLALGDAFARASDVERAKDTFLHAAATARQLGAAESFAAATLGFGGVVVGVGTVDATLVSLLEESLARLEERDDPVRARVQARLATELYFTADDQRPAALSQDAVDMARRLGDPGALIHALEARHFSVWGTDDAAERLALANEIVRLAEELNNRDLLLRGYHFRISDLLEIGDVAMVDVAIAAYAGLANELRQPAYAWRLDVFQAMRALLRGRFAEAEALSAAAFAVGQRVQAQTAANFFGVQLCMLRREQGRLGEIEESVRAFVEAYPAVPSWRTALANVYAELGREDDARVQFEHLAANRFADLPRDNSRVMGLTLLAEVCAALADRERAAILYEQLLPSAARNIVAGTAAACNGPVARPLGLLAATLERWDDAAAHFRFALEMTRAMGAVPLIARTQQEYAALLLAAPPHAGQAATARALLEEALRSAIDLGMASIAARATGLLAQVCGRPVGRCGPLPGHADGGSADRRAAAVFRREGEFWTLTFAGETCRLEDTRGLRYLAVLLRSPHVEVPALQLVQQQGGAPVADGAPPPASSAGPRLDLESRRAYRRRLGELESALERARSAGQAARAAELERENEFLTRELRQGVGLGGRERLVGADRERARSGVTRAIRLALAAIEKQHAPLAAHLAAAIRTGTSCCYDPVVEQQVEWEL
jgi:tetratricopeptide (TPR) repeat protein